MGDARCYELGAETVGRLFDHLPGMSHVTIERWATVKDAVDPHRRGRDSADALR